MDKHLKKIETLIKQLKKEKKEYEKAAAKINWEDANYQDTEDLGAFNGKAEILGDIIKKLTDIVLA